MILYGIGLLTTYFYMSGCAESDKVTQKEFIKNLKTGGPIGAGIGTWAYYNILLAFDSMDSSLCACEVTGRPCPLRGVSSCVLSSSIGSITGATLQKTLFPRSGVFGSFLSGCGGAIGVTLAILPNLIADFPSSEVAGGLLLTPVVIASTMIGDLIKG